MEKAEFTERFVAAAGKAYPGMVFKITGELAVDYEEKVAASPGGKPAGGVMYLDNAWTQYLSHREDFDEIIRQRVASIQALSDHVTCTPDKVMPTLKPLSYIAFAQQMFEKNAAEHPDQPAAQGRMIQEPFAGDVGILYVLDTPQATRTLGIADLKDCGLSVDDFAARSRVNLRAKLAQFEIRSPAGLPGVRVVNGDNYYETSLLLIDEFWTRERFPVKGEIVVAVPARGWLLVADSQDSATVIQLAGIANKANRGEAYPLTANLFRRTAAGSWVVFTP